MGRSVSGSGGRSVGWLVISLNRNKEKIKEPRSIPIPSRHSRRYI